MTGWWGERVCDSKENKNKIKKDGIILKEKKRWKLLKEIVDKEKLKDT